MSEELAECKLQLGLTKIALEYKTNLLKSCEIALIERDKQLSKQKRKAELWDAFTSLGRIRILGWAKLGEEGYQHIGFELWTMWGTFEEDSHDFTKTNADAVKNFELFLDAWILTQQEAKK